MPEHDLELGPAGPGRAAPNPHDAVSLPEPPAQPESGGVTSLLGAASKAIPHVQAVMKGIAIAKEVYEALKPQPVQIEKGEGKALEPFIKESNKDELDRVLRYKMASMLVTDIMRIGKMFGVDFSTWMGGMPSDVAAPATAAPNAAPGATPDTTPVPPTPAPAPAPAAHAPAAAPPKTNPRAEMLVNQLQALSLEDLKSRANKWLHQLIESNTHQLGRSAGPVAMNKWYWNGGNERGHGEAPEYKGLRRFDPMWAPDGYDPDHDKRTSVTISWYMEIAGIPDGVMAGLPKEVMHFDPMTIESNEVRGLGWYTGGSCESWYREAHGDNVKLTINGTRGTPAVQGPMGGYPMRFEFQWDNSVTTMKCDVLAFAGAPWPIVANIDTGSKIPET